MCDNVGVNACDIIIFSISLTPKWAVSIMLTDLKLRRLKAKNKIYRVPDEKGLVIEVRTTGNKYWRFRYRFKQQQKMMALGEYPLISLSDARLARDEIRIKLHKGIDPITELQEKREEKKRIEVHMFSLVVDEWYETRQKGRIAAKTRERTESLINKDIKPQIGNMDIRDLKSLDILNAIRKIEQRGAIDLAYKAMTIISQVMRYGICTDRCERDLTTDLKGALQPNKVGHYAATTDPQKFRKLLLAIEAYVGSKTVKNALLLHSYLFQRPGEIRTMEWDEIDFDKKLWNIPAAKMKTRQPHIVPLSKQAIEIIKEQQKITTGKYVLPSHRSPNRPMSDNTVNCSLRTMGYDRTMHTAHGFRATARTLLDEELEVPVEHIEQQLAHSVRDPLGRAYNRTKHLRQRTEMMQKWADYIDNQKDSA